MQDNLNGFSALGDILNAILITIKSNQLTEITFEVFNDIVNSVLTEETWVELLTQVDCEDDGISQLWRVFKEYLFHISTETHQFKLIHNALQVYFIDLKSVTGCIVVNFNDIPANDLNVLLGI